MNWLPKIWLSAAAVRGTHVTYKYTPKPVQAPLLGVLEEIDSIAQNSVAEVLDCRRGGAPAKYSSEFSLGNNDSLFHLVRKRERAGAFFGYFDSWSAGVDMPTTPRFLSTSLATSIFARAAWTVSHINQTISAVPASEQCRRSPASSRRLSR